MLSKRRKALNWVKKLVFKLLRHPLSFQLVRYGIIGGLAAIVYFTVVIVLVEIAYFQPLIANLCGFFSGFLISFLGHRFWTFSETSRTVRDSLHCFFLIATFNFVGNQTLYYFLFAKLHMQYIFALVLVLGFMALITFCLSKWWVFR